ncbi:FtsX-like permease family protein [Ichthyenterobacterium sp. W332]|uniref:FtsX-like permease family protein n=1 Tax=Microcosmobacter mediterraneus TaxID=3075607 RepID=A0ABU2YJC6_9FLAO|nr:FtsX-like permease family protein [Ichthyenterobacterium sp. W332]MDT0558278.1 FtsX-like permease family protein [Ichthyenterobacterium sp. W332]
MNFELFIAKRIIGSKSYKSSVSAPIIKIGITAITIGMVVMLVAIATGLGLQQKIRDKVVAFNGHIVVSNYDNNASNESIVPISINQDFYPEFKTVEGVKYIQPVAAKFGLIRTETNVEGVVLKGVASDYNWSYFETFLVEGSLPNFNDTMSNSVLISSIVANRLNLKSGDKFQMVFGEDLQKVPRIRSFTISGVFSSGFEELDKTFILGDIRHIQRLNRWEKEDVGSFEIFIDDYSKLDEKTTEIYESIPSLLNARKVSDKYYSVFEWIKIFDNNVYGIIGIMILVAGINMITALLVLILERTQMIGILKALGSSNFSIRKIFLTNASYLVGLGLLWGNIIGIGLLLIQKYFKIIPLNPDTYYVNEAPVYLSFDYILLLNIGTFIACMLLLVIPSVIISKITPVKAIRFD